MKYGITQHIQDNMLNEIHQSSFSSMDILYENEYVTYHLSFFQMTLQRYLQLHLHPDPIPSLPPHLLYHPLQEVMDHIIHLHRIRLHRDHLIHLLLIMACLHPSR